MITLRIDNSVSQVSGLTAEQLATLRDRVSMVEETWGFVRVNEDTVHRIRSGKRGITIKDHRGIPRQVVNKRFHPFKSVNAVRDAIAKDETVMARGYVVKKTPLVSRRGEFASGLMPYVQSFINEVPHTAEDRRIRPQSRPGMFKLTLPVTPYFEQEKAVAAALRAHEGRGVISAVTGSGKSILICMLIAALNVRTLVIVPNLALKQQLKETLRQCFGSLENITVENIGSPKLKTATDYGCLIWDECHHAAAATYRRLNKTAWTGIYHRFAFSGSPFRAKHAENLLLEGIIGRPVFKLGYREAVQANIVAPIEAYYYSLPEIECKTNSWPAVYSALVVNRTDRNALISCLVQNLHSQHISSLTLVKEVAHGQTLADLTGAAFAHGENEETQQLISWFNSGKLKSLLGTTGVLGEGIDCKPAEYVLVACLGKSKPAFLQQVGRVIRRYPGKESGKVILFKDPSHRFTLEHFEAQCQYLRDEYGVEPVELPLPEDFAA